ncbi:hypothetical protein [Pseudomonas sp. QD4]|uniref:hypothetical protein n=1 Tax=Pseudomonas sp. QD4 TaxID=3368618 RepID=UPI003BA01732
MIVSQRALGLFDTAPYAAAQQAFLTYERREKGAQRSVLRWVVAFVSKPSLERLASSETHMQWVL